MCFNLLGRGILFLALLFVNSQSLANKFLFEDLGLSNRVLVFLKYRYSHIVPKENEEQRKSLNLSASEISNEEQRRLDFHSYVSRVWPHDAEFFRKNRIQLESQKRILMSHPRWRTLYQHHANQFTDQFELQRIYNNTQHGVGFEYNGEFDFLFVPELFGLQRKELFDSWAKLDKKYAISTHLSVELFVAAEQGASKEEFIAIINRHAKSDIVERGSNERVRYKTFDKGSLLSTEVLSDDKNGTSKKGFVYVFKEHGETVPNEKRSDEYSYRTIKEGPVPTDMPLTDYIILPSSLSHSEANRLKAKVNDLRNDFLSLVSLFDSMSFRLGSRNVPNEKMLESYYKSEGGFWTLMALMHKIAYRSYALKISDSRVSHILKGDFAPPLRPGGSLRLAGGLHSVDGFNQFSSNIPDTFILENTSLPNGVRRVVFNEDSYKAKVWKKMKYTSSTGNNKLGGKTLFPDFFDRAMLLEAIEHIGKNPMVELESTNWWSKSLMGFVLVTIPGMRAPTEVWMRVDFNPVTKEVYSAYPIWQQPGAIEQDLNSKLLSERQAFRLRHFWYATSDRNSAFQVKTNEKVDGVTFSRFLDIVRLKADNHYAAFSTLGPCGKLFSAKLGF